jgi:drug/metabolite transporter (DMT)-like permease
MVIIGAFCFSMTMIYVHSLSKQVNTIVNLHYSYISHMCLTGILSNFQPPTVIFSDITVSVVLAFGLVVIFALLAQYMIFAATSLKEPSYTMPLGYLAIVVGFLADIAFFKVEFNSLTVIGMLLTSAGLLSKLAMSGEKVKAKSEYRSNRDIISEKEEMEEE